MWNNSDEITVASGGQVYVAPVGTALPTSPTANLNSAFVGLGFASEDGVTITVTPDITEFAAWQSRQSVRRELTAQELQASFSLLQWNEETVPLAFGGGSITAVSGGYRYNFPSGSDSLDERAMIIDADDGDRRTRFVFPRGNVVESVESQFTRASMSMLPITFKALEPTDGAGAGYVLFSDDAAFAAGS